MKERELWIGMLKGYGIFVVTLGHAGVISLGRKTYLFISHVSLFLCFRIFIQAVKDKRCSA